MAMIKICRSLLKGLHVHYARKAMLYPVSLPRDKFEFLRKIRSNSLEITVFLTSKKQYTEIQGQRVNLNYS